MVEIDRVTFAYRRKQPLFAALDASLLPGTIYGLLGRNGAGKTTLLKLISGLLFPQDGGIHVLGFDSSERSPGLLEEIIFVGEEFPTPHVTVRAYRALYAPLYPRFDGSEFARHLAEFEIDDRTSIDELSYGQKKKVLLAFGLAAHTRLLILDEPTNGLDIPSKGQFRRLLAGATDDERVIVVSTHQVRDLEQLIDPIAILEAGRIVFQHGVDELASRLRFVHSPEIPAGALYGERAMGGYAAGIAALLFESNPGIVLPNTPAMWETIGGYLVAQPIFLFGSVYFRKNAFLKTSLSILAVVGALTVIWLVAVRVMYAEAFRFIQGNWGVRRVVFESIALTPLGESFIASLQVVGGVLRWVVTPVLFWTLGVLRLRETEV